MTQSSGRSAGSGTLGLAAAIVATLGLAYFGLVEFTAVGVSGWLFFDPGLAGPLLSIVALACAVAATVDSWLALSGARRRPPRSYLRAGGILLIVACVAAGPLLAIPLLPGLALTWLAYAQWRPAESQVGTGPRGARTHLTGAST